MQVGDPGRSNRQETIDADVLKTNRFNSAQDMAQTLTRYVALYNRQFPQSALKRKNADADHERLVRYASTSLPQTSL
jgi:hypothetical protein